MSPKQALAACNKIDPKRSYCVQRRDWSYNFDGDNKSTDYRIAILPGLSGDDCDHFDSPTSLADCVAQYRNAYAAVGN